MKTLDTVVVGGGIAGLWSLSCLTAQGRSAILLEADQLGSAQTLASQGMVHGGLKYALGGVLSGAAEAIATMPERWRACLDGTGELDLVGLEPLAQRYYMFAQASALGRLTGFFASRSLRGRIEKLASQDYPEVFAHPNFSGVVYGLNDFVLHTPSLLKHLAALNPGRLYQHRLQAQEVTLSDRRVELAIAGERITAKHLLITAGSGAAELLGGLGISEPAMQRRGLHQIVVRAPNLPALFAHCLTGISRAEPRLTITSHRDTNGDWLWYLGGQLANDGVDRTDIEQVDFARRELASCVPWLDWQHAQLNNLRIDRAEPAQQGGLRPDEAFVVQRGPVIVAWPTKLSLVPDLGERALEFMPAAATQNPADTQLAIAPATLASEPWLLPQAKD